MFKMEKDKSANKYFNQFDECNVCFEEKDVFYLIAPCGHSGTCLDCLTHL